MGKSTGDYSLVDDSEDGGAAQRAVMRSYSTRGSYLTSIPFRVGVFFIAFIIFWGWPIVSIPAGHSGVVDLWGFVEQNTIPAGVHLKTVFADVHTFSLKTQLFEVTQDAPTSEGLIVELDVSVLFRVEPKTVRSLYVTIGNNYREVLVKPEITSCIRSLTSRFTAKTLYSAGRDEMSAGIVEQLNEKLNPRGITVEQALLRKVLLPKLVTTAIEEKLKAEQESQRMEFVLQKEKSEADRKRIEAQGISDFQKIVSEGISPELLEWKGIETTEKLATSNNAKVVVIGSQKNGMPLILGDGPMRGNDGPHRHGEHQLE